MFVIVTFSNKRRGDSINSKILTLCLRVVTHVSSRSFLVITLIACSGFSSLRPLSPLLEITETAREDELLPSSSNQGLDPKTFLTPLSNISSQHQGQRDLRNLTCTETPPLFTITPLVSLNEDNPEPDSTTFDTFLGWGDILLII